MKKTIKICLMLFLISASIFAYETDEKKPSFSINGEVQGNPEDSFRLLVLAKDFDRLDQIKNKDSSVLAAYFDDYFVSTLIDHYYGGDYISESERVDLGQILQYFYHNHLDFPQVLDLETYEKIQSLLPKMKDIKLVKDDFETDQEFNDRRDTAIKETDELITWIGSSKYINITHRSFDFSYDEYHVEDGYFDCNFNFKNNTDFIKSKEIELLEKFHFRFYVDRKSAKAIRDAQEEFTHYPVIQECLVMPKGDGKFEIASLKFGLNSDEYKKDSEPSPSVAPVPDNLYAFMVRQGEDETGGTTLIIQNFHAQNKLFLSGKELTEELTTFTIPADGEYILSKNADGSGILWHSTLLKKYKVGSKGPCGGIVFYDKGSYSDGWRYLEAAPLQDAKELLGPDYGDSYVVLRNEIGCGYINTIRNIYDNKVTQYGLAYNCGDLREWFIPSLNELKEMYKNRQLLGGFLKGKQYWTSSKEMGQQLSFPVPRTSENDKAIAWPIRRF